MSSAESDTQNQQTIAAIRYKPYSKYSTAPSTACNQQPNQPYNDYPSTHSTRQNQQTSLTNSSQPCTCGERIQAHLTAQTAEVQLEDLPDKLGGACSTAFPSLPREGAIHKQTRPKINTWSIRNRHATVFRASFGSEDMATIFARCRRRLRDLGQQWGFTRRCPSRSDTSPRIPGCYTLGVDVNARDGGGDAEGGESPLRDAPCQEQRCA